MFCCVYLFAIENDILESNVMSLFCIDPIGYVSSGIWQWWWPWQADSLGLIFTKISKNVGVDEVITISDFGFNRPISVVSDLRIMGVTIFTFSHWLCRSYLQQCYRYRTACDQLTRKFFLRSISMFPIGIQCRPLIQRRPIVHTVIRT